jgi:Signal peptidase subunit
MHTVWVRLNAVVFFGLTVLLGLSMLAAFSKIGHSSRHKPGASMYSIRGTVHKVHDMKTMRQNVVSTFVPPVKNAGISTVKSCLVTDCVFCQSQLLTLVFFFL